jgi:cellobiose-specific phosphotransferase system component IIC
MRGPYEDLCSKSLPNELCSTTVEYPCLLLFDMVIVSYIFSVVYVCIDKFVALNMKSELCKTITSKLNYWLEDFIVVMYLYLLAVFRWIC